MLFTLLIGMLLSTFRSCGCSPTFQEEYRGSYVPKTIETAFGLQVVAPDTPYVAAAGKDRLDFIDTRFDAETARHIKEQIERAFVPKSDEYISIDEFAATAEVKNAVTGETTFVFNPAYARVLFAKGMNRRNPQLKLPEHEPAGHWQVTYDLGNTLTKRGYFCSDYGCYNKDNCKSQTNNHCDVCIYCHVDNECDAGTSNAIDGCHPYFCKKAVDTPKEDGETDAEYYQRMDKLHWG